MRVNAARLRHEVLELAEGGKKQVVLTLALTLTPNSYAFLTPTQTFDPHPKPNP